MGRRSLLAILAVMLAACGHGASVNAPPDTPPPATSALSVRQWTSDALPLVDRVSALLDAAGRGARRGDIAAFQAAAIQLAQALGRVRSALGGPVPGVAAPEASALLRMTSEYEAAARSASGCGSVAACLASLDSVDTVANSWADALGALAAES